MAKVSEPKTICIEAWNVDFIGNFDLGGDITIQIQGATNGGKGKEHLIKLSACEYTLAALAQDIRDKFRMLKAYRARRDRENLEVFKETSDE